MATRPKSSERDAVTDGSRVLAAARSNFAGFKRFDARRKIKLMPQSFLDAFDGRLKEANKALGKQKVVKGARKSATLSEEASRAVLFDLLRDARDDLELSYPEQPGIARTFGAGTAMRSNSTPELLAAADVMVTACEDEANAQLAEEAGVDAAAIAAIATARARLHDADTAQSGALTAAMGGTQDKDALIAQVRKDTTRIRAVAGRVFRKDAKTLAKFKSTIVRVTPKKRGPKTPPSPASK